MDATKASVEPQPIFLADYQPPDYLIDNVALTFDLIPDATIVSSRITLNPNPAANGAGDRPVRLHGEDLDLLSVTMDGATVDYDKQEDELILPPAPDGAVVETRVKINPAANTRLEGLYVSSGNFCTQCEAEGFRRITYFPDRPDVMTSFTVTLRADKKTYPVLLSNGNLIESRDLDDGRHEAVWHDPHKKPAYLFALVAADLGMIEDQFTTMSGRDVTLRIYVEHGNEARADYAMDALKRSMKWDEDTYGREYDLDLFNIVAVSDFNMGAMENKSLNIFNAKLILADPDTATDVDYTFIESVVAHEYFHNWSGNRVTCRDWFQLSLKEGFTVFRDQQFSADQRSAAVQRIDDVRTLRARQFPEDAGPLAHPVRPESFIEINNFYTATVYEKGAELIRMMHSLLGAEDFRKGSDLYFDRHDGQAVTCDDFVAAMEDASGKDLTQFKRWYHQAGTPDVSVAADYADGCLTLSLAQHLAPTPGQDKKDPQVIPLKIGLIGEDGGEAEAKTIILDQSEMTVTFDGLSARPALSLNRDFSAPVRLRYEMDDDEAARLMAHDPNPFARFEAGQRYASRLLLAGADGGDHAVPDAFMAAFKGVLDADLDPAFRTQMLALPGISELGEEQAVTDYDGLFAIRQAWRKALAAEFKQQFQSLYDGLRDNAPFSPDAESAGRRSLKNLALGYLAETGDEGFALADNQFKTADNMTDRMAALRILNDVAGPARTDALKAFEGRFKDDALVMDKWFALQAMSCLPDALDQVKALMDHPAFTIKNPNKVRSLIGAFSQSNVLRFHGADGAGFEFLADQIIALNSINPQIAARLVAPLGRWKRFDGDRADKMKAALTRILETPDLSRDVYELATKARQG